MMEEWRPIQGWPRHEVSSLGNFRTVRKTKRMGQKIKSISPWLAKVGYQIVTLYNEENPKRGKKFYVHRVVCEAFHGPAPTPKHEVGHGNGQRTDNRAENLRWVTRKENCEDSAHHGTRLRGERQNGAKLTDSKVLEIRRRLGEGERTASLAAEFNVTRGCIEHVRDRATWTHI